MNVVTIICWSALLALTSRYAIWYISTFRKALRIEASTPLPSVRIYTPRYSPLVYVISPYIAPAFKYLPFGWGEWMRYAVRDCTWQHKGTLPRKELGSAVYWTLGPGGAQLWVGDADLISDITHRWKDFPKPVMYYTQLQLFGENVLTAEGPLWQFHRKITVRSFNPKNNSLVFTESQEQAKAMVRSWSKESRTASSGITVDDLESWVTKLALHIISAAGFGHQMQWDGHQTQKVTFAESLKTFVDEIWLLMILPDWFLKFSPWAHLRRVHKAPDIFANHVQQAINETKSEDNTQRKNDLLSNMINSDGISHGSDKGGLSDPEITSNVFIFTLAGHETTATTIQTALVLLAVHPELQQWIHEELDVIYGEKPQGEGLVYESDYPKMRRVMALMLETLRVFPSISGIPKWTADKHQTAQYNGQTIDMPPDTSILLDVVAVHRNPKYWGQDAAVFRPSRWIMDEGYEPPTNSVSHSKVHANMLCPPKGAFIVFSDGHRDCLGKGFAQAEFCAVVATLLKDCSIELVPPEGSTPSDAVWNAMCQNAWKALDDRRNMTSFKMYGKVPVRFVPRGSEWRRR